MMEFYSAVNNEETIPFARVWMNLEDMPSEINQTEKDKISFIYKIQKKKKKPSQNSATKPPQTKLIEKEIRLVVTRRGEQGGGVLEKGGQKVQTSS